MVARGRYGHSLQQSLLVVDIDVPISLRLKINGDKALRNVGNRVASYVRRQLRAGLDGDGSPLPRPKDGGSPLNRTGELIRSIKYHRHLQMVAPGTRTRADISSRARSNYGLMAIHIAGIYHRRGSPDRADLLDPMHSIDPSMTRRIVEWTERELVRQEKLGQFGLLAEFKKRRVTR